MLDLSRLSLEQRQAVLAGDGPLLIVAGPGSGKTTVLAARIAYLVVGRHIPPTSILAIAFATKAARELRARLVGVLGDAGRAVEVTTFHALGLRIIRQWREELGFGPGPLAVYDDREARALLVETATALGLDTTRETVPQLVATLTRHRLRGEPPKDADPLHPLAEAYETALRRRCAVDFPAMLTLPLRLFETHPEALRVCQDAYRHVLCDEFQDVCAAQYALLRRLTEAHGNLTVVGDPCQTVYGWRGADVRFLLHFQRDFPRARLIHLHQNFRATRRLVELANALGAELAYGRPLRSDNPLGDRARLYLARDEATEVAFVAQEIERLRAVGEVERLGEVAVLYRTNPQAHRLGVALRQHGIPYWVRGRGDLFARREVQDALAYLRLAYDPADTAALARIINIPPHRLSRLAELVSRQPTPAHDLPPLAQPLGPRAVADVEALASVIDELHAQSARGGPYLLLDAALDRSGYRDWLADQMDGAQRLEHLAELRRLLVTVDTNQADWLAEGHLSDDVDTADEADQVVLTTIHAAKGGEWRVVFVVGVEEGLLPHTHALAHDADMDAALEEELRLAYVAVTRPRERLYLTCSRWRQRGDQRYRCQPSRFLHGLPLDSSEGNSSR
ncbi:MAG: UvrD-helicase domain-containing protein [Anaerolineae bacterium]|nr:UvrD-helicase domain-containing protein [Anaerolineae bacterium]